MFGIGMGEFILILIVGLIVFGPGKLPEVGRALGKGLREFRKAQAALTATLEESADEPPKKSAPPENKPVTLEKKSEPEPEPARTTVEDVIATAKQNPIVKEQKID
ncbi:MAG: twin-arginine translocase TatA/TatE family subunit [Selenomonadaceae bacterium]|nr:twin-arginine translocase TatA/TatE family subunit [Selenomonadaceae bacterium]